MLPLRSKVIAFVVAVTLACTAQTARARVDVEVEFDKNFDFKAVRTWGWNAAGPGEVKMARSKEDDGAVMTRKAEPVILDAVSTEMPRRGLQPATAAPDLTLTYYLLLTTGMSTQTMGQFLPGTTEWGIPPFAGATQSMKIMNQGSLVLDLSANGKVVWRGVAKARIKIDADDKKREALLREGITRSTTSLSAEIVTPMRRCVPAVLLNLAYLVVPAVSDAQDLTPRAYLPLPISSNALGLTYGLSRGEIVFDPTLPVSDASGTIHSPIVTYYRTFDFFGRSANITGVLPFAVGNIRAKLSGEEREAHRAGLADTVVRVAVSLRGGPALSLAEFVKTQPARSVWGASLKVVMPTGQYDQARLINIGAHRWAFKPELGYAGRAGRVTIDAYAGVWFFTANNKYFASAAEAPPNTRTQDPIAALEFHASYDVKPRLWISADLNYWRGGRTSVNGIESANTLQANSRLGVTGSVPLTRQQSLKVSFSDGVVVRVGGRFRILTVGWQYGWISTPQRRN